MRKTLVRLGELLLRMTSATRRRAEPSPLLVELFEKPDRGAPYDGNYPFSYGVTLRGGSPFYDVYCSLPTGILKSLRAVVQDVSRNLDPREVEPLTFERLVEVLTQRSAECMEPFGIRGKIKELSELAAYEEIGLSRLMAISKDENVTEFFVDSEATSVYLDHALAGRCESKIVLTERERDALRTHLDVFSGYTLDYGTPSMKNDLRISGAVLRVSLDLEPLSVNRFALDVRRLNVNSLSLPRLISLGVISEEAAALLVSWLESGGNVTIVGETGTGKTTLLNALDEVVDKRLRRVYIEDAVETRDLLGRGYHQMKVKVDPFERGEEAGRTKESEIVKALHRSPDMVILSEIQSEEHSRAFFQALASGVRGLQTFHASTVEQAIRRWVSVHHIPELNLIDLGLLVQMSRPDRLRQERYVQRICEVTEDPRGPKVRELYMRDREYRMRNVYGQGVPFLPPGVEPSVFSSRLARALDEIGRVERQQ